MSKMEPNRKQIIDAHKPGLAGILNIYTSSVFLKKPPFLISTLICAGITISIFLYKVDPYLFLHGLIEQLLSMFPNLLGFNLGGYALIVGFGNTALLQAMTKPSNGVSHSIFQQLNAIFAFSIILQVLTLLLGFLLSLIDSLDFKTANFFLADFINILVTIPLLLLCFWSLLMIPYVVSNIFNFGQMHHFFLNNERISKERQASGESQEGKQ